MLNTAVAELQKTKRVEPTLGAITLQLIQEIKETKAAKKHCKSNCLIRGAKQQRTIYLHEKYDNLANGMIRFPTI